MYKIIGADGKEYGPVSAGQIRQWITEGRSNAQTRVQPEGGTEWKELGTLPEFAAALAAKSGPAPIFAPGAVGISDSQAMQKVQGPAIALIISGSLGILFGLFGLVTALMGKPAQTATPPPGMEEYFRMIEQFSSGPFQYMQVALGLLCSSLVLFGAIKMRRLESYGLAMTAAIITVIPVCTCCCYGWPIGIWALVVLSKPDVKAAFT